MTSELDYGTLEVLKRLFQGATVINVEEGISTAMVTIEFIGNESEKHNMEFPMLKSGETWLINKTADWF